MTAPVRNILLVLLTMTSGCVDAISFLALGQVFTAAMTGNTVLFGLSLAHAGGLSAIGYLIAVCGFAFGAALGAVCLRRIQMQTGWNRLITFVIALEWFVLFAFGIVVTVWPTTSSTGAEAHLLIALLATAMGIQGVTARRIGMNGVTTTVITSTLTGLMESLVWNVGAALKGGANRRTGGKKDMGGDGTAQQAARTPVSSILMWMTVIVFYAIGAFCCGLFETHWRLHAIWLPVSIVLVVILTAVITTARVQVTTAEQVRNG